MIWQPDYSEEILLRLTKEQSLLNNLDAQSGMMAYYAQNPAAWIEEWAITYDPRIKSPGIKTMPFLLFPRQKQFVQFLYECTEDKESGLVEKARDMGATWLCCAFSVWMWLFVEGTSIGWGSRKEDLVDTLGDPDSIFEKMRLIIKNLPSFMLPTGFNEKKHMGYMKIMNPENNSIITGEGGDNIGRGGRSTIYFKDESAHYEHPEKIEAALGDNTDVQIDISSVNGTANVFYRRRMAGEEWHEGEKITPGKTRVFIFDWRDHPNKSQAWYDQRRKKYEDEGLLHLFAQEVERNYSAALDKIIIDPAWIEAAIDAHIKLGFGDDGEKSAGQDVADEGGDKNALAIGWGVILKYAEHWGGDAGDAAGVSLPHCIEYGVRDLYYDSIGVGSGFKVGWNNLKALNKVPNYMKLHAWNAGAAVLEPTKRVIPHDVDSMKNEDFFGNLKAQGWWRLRIRFKKTYEAVRNGAKYNSSELISLPSTLKNLQQIKMELSQAVRKYDGKGRVIVDKKPKGSKSPNLADAIVIRYTPVKKVSILDVI